MSELLALSECRSVIQANLKKFINEKATEYSSYYWGLDVLSRLEKYVLSGKMLRGSLVLLSYGLLDGKELDQIIPAASAVEMLQAGLLIHDDMIDQDDMRRGQPALHTQYLQVAKAKGYAQAKHQGQALAICVGDITFFMSFELLNMLPVTQKTSQKINQLMAKEFSLVGLAEMQDIHQALTRDKVTEAEILFLYRYKTGRYTFSFPLMLGALLAGANANVVEQLEQLGEVLGLIYQIKDDELGLFGTAKEIGKSVISDVREGKKTLYYLYSFELASSDQKQTLARFFGNQDVTETDVEQVKQIVIACGAKTKVDEKLEVLRREAQQLIENLPIPGDEQQQLVHFLNFNLLRQK